jgi:hypothetical protein
MLGELIKFPIRLSSLSFPKPCPSSRRRPGNEIHGLRALLDEAKALQRALPDEGLRIVGRGANKEDKAAASSPSGRLNGSVAEGCDRQPKARDQACGTPVIVNFAAQLLYRGVDQSHAIPLSFR